MTKSLLEQIAETKQYLQGQTRLRPEVGIILGSGLGGLAEEIEPESVIPYEQIPHFTITTVEFHHGRLIFGRLGKREVMAMQGRFHCYEGYSMQEVTFPIRVMKALAVNALLISNIGGSLNPEFKAGDLMIMTDHINLLGSNPLIGPNYDELGPRFPDMSEPYSRELIALAEGIAAREGIPVRKGVYVALQGPNLETRAEYKFLRKIGADIVGMSTIPEVIIAVHAGMKVLGFSVISDEASDPENLKPTSIEEIIKTAEKAEPMLTLLMKKVVEKL